MTLGLHSFFIQVYLSHTQRGVETVKELLELIKKDLSAWDYYVPSLEDLVFISDIEKGF